ncbi:substrate-binding periplasmic protein [Succinivibrio dextrinosolvens]|nr:ABC transporter substrate-binding protein [Succinivibrio dextrinosolvens]
MRKRTINIIIIMYVILFTATAISFIRAKNNTLHVGVDGYCAPFSITSSQGELSGYNIDVISAIARALNYKIEFRIIPFTALEKDLKRRLVDVVIAPMDSGNDKNIRPDIIYTNPYYFNNLTILKKIDREISYTEKGFGKGTKICLPNKPYILDYVRSHFDGTVIKIYNGSKNAVDAIYKNQCDVVVDTKSSNEYYRTKHRLNKMEVKPIYNAYEYDHIYKIAMNANKRYLKERINKAIEHLIQTGELNRIHEKWFSSKYQVKKI